MTNPYPAPAHRPQGTSPGGNEVGGKMVSAKKDTSAIGVNLGEYMWNSYMWSRVRKAVWTPRTEPGSACSASPKHQGKTLVISKWICFFWVLFSSLSPNEDGLKIAYYTHTELLKGSTLTWDFELCTYSWKAQPWKQEVTNLKIRELEGKNSGQSQGQLWLRAFLTPVLSDWLLTPPSIASRFSYAYSHLLKWAEEETAFHQQGWFTSFHFHKDRTRDNKCV